MVHLSVLCGQLGQGVFQCFDGFGFPAIHPQLWEVRTQLLNPMNAVAKVPLGCQCSSVRARLADQSYKPQWLMKSNASWSEACCSVVALATCSAARMLSTCSLRAVSSETRVGDNSEPPLQLQLQE